MHPKRFASLPWLGLWILAGISSSPLAQHGHGDFCDPDTAVAKPILSVGDFNGNGIVEGRDILLVSRRARSGEYIAFFDRNADYTVDRKDVAITAREIGSPSTFMDQQLAAAFWGTVRYRDQNAAIADGYIPFTQTLYGHGQHWAQHPANGNLDYHFKPGNPEGLNYDESGNLWGIFYYVGPSASQPDGTLYPPGDAFNPLAPLPAGFVGDEDPWHHHAGVCLLGINYENPEMDPENLSFLECLSPNECAQAALEGGYTMENTRWTPKFYMIHAWLYELNPCGTFAGAHPLLAMNATHPDLGNPTGEPCDTWDLHPDFPFVLGTLCNWLTELGERPDFCPTSCISN